MAFVPPPIRSIVAAKPIVSYDTMKEMLIAARIISPDKILSDDRKTSVCIYKEGGVIYVIKLGNNAPFEGTTKARLLQNEERAYVNLTKLPPLEYTKYFPRIIRSGYMEDYTNREKNFYYIILEYIDSVPLYEYINHYITRSPPSKDNVFTILENLTKALATMHSAGIVHGDLSADNIMLEENGEVKIIDFEKGSTVKKLDENTIGSTGLNPGSTERDIELEEINDEGIGYLFLVMKLLSLIRFPKDLILEIIAIIWQSDPSENVYAKCLPIIAAFKAGVPVASFVNKRGMNVTSPTLPQAYTPASSVEPMNTNRRKLRKRKSRKL